MLKNGENKLGVMIGVASCLKQLFGASMIELELFFILKLFYSFSLLIITFPFSLCLESNRTGVFPCVLNITGSSGLSIPVTVIQTGTVIFLTDFHR